MSLQSHDISIELEGNTFETDADFDCEWDCDEWAVEFYRLTIGKLKVNRTMLIDMIGKAAVEAMEERVRDGLEPPDAFDPDEWRDRQEDARWEAAH
jgi:hypothetical protein